jgi:putative addiction module component (TIGR02574 family)
MLPAKKIISEALRLRAPERFIVIDALINSLDIPDPKVEKIWADEAERRLSAYKKGKLKTISFENMFKASSK